MGTSELCPMWDIYGERGNLSQENGLRKAFSIMDKFHKMSEISHGTCPMGQVQWGIWNIDYGTFQLGPTLRNYLDSSVLGVYCVSFCVLFIHVAFLLLWHIFTHMVQNCRNYHHYHNNKMRLSPALSASLLIILTPPLSGFTVSSSVFCL